MTGIAIRCHSCTPASTTELTVWLEQRVDELRSRTPLLVRVSSLTCELPTTAVDDGWLLELEVPMGLPDEELDDALRAVREVVRDMRVLGFTPTVLAPAELRSQGGRLRRLDQELGRAASAPGLRRSRWTSQVQTAGGSLAGNDA